MVRSLSFTKTYSSKCACREIDFEARRGEITVLLGPNGAGKSTLLKALAGHHYATKGRVLAEQNDGEFYDASESPEGVKSIVGFISEVPALYDDWTVLEFLRMAADLRLPKKTGEKKSRAALAKEAVQKAARLCNLNEVLGQKISSLSHGYKQRVNFAQALVNNPQILILDEPSAGLDPEQISEMRSLVQRLKKGRAIVFSTHIIQEAQSLADKIYIIKDSRVVAFGSPDSLIKESGEKTLEDAYLFFAGKKNSVKKSDADFAPDDERDGADSLCGPAIKPQPARQKAAPFFSLVKKEMRSYAINPFYWISGIVFALFCAASYFYGTRFFVQGIGSASLSPFFLAMPFILSVFIPSFCMNAKSRAFDQSLAFGEFSKAAARVLAGLALFVFYLIGTAFVPVCVSFFGSVDLGAVLTAYLGLLFFAAACVSFCVFLSCLFKSQAAYYAFAVLSLSAINLFHNILNYVQPSDFFALAVRSLSFAWRFDSASKGIFDTRDFSFFAAASLMFVALCAFVSERKKGKRFFCARRAASSWTIVFIFVFLFLDTNRVYKRVDFSAGKNYTPSERTRLLLSGAEEKIKITYCRSAELLRLYPQVRDVGDFLRSLSYSAKNVFYTELDASSSSAKKILSSLDVQPLQLQSQKGDSLEYVNAYSTIVIDYMDKSVCLPAAFSTFSLEYDLNVRLDYLIKQKSRRVYLLCANGMSLKKDYKSALDWLNLEGFETVELFESGLTEARLDKKIPLALFGTKNLSYDQAAALQDFLADGGSVFATLSPYSVDIDGNWSLSKNKGDFFLPILEREGIFFSDSLAADISCVRANFYSPRAGGKNGENKSVNYPLWISLLPQESLPFGANVFWASPLSLDKDKAKALFTTSRAAWTFLPDKKNPELLFDTNPFTVPKTAVDDPLVKKGQSVLAARSIQKKLLVLSGDLFVNDLLLSLSGGETGDFRNLNFLTCALLELSGEGDMAALKNKGASDFSLWKISEKKDWDFYKKLSLFLSFLSPVIVASVFMALFFLRRRRFIKKTWAREAAK